jgi:hypothetical protein
MTLQEVLQHIERTANAGVRLRATLDLSGQDKEVSLRYQWGESVSGLTPEQINKIAKANENK